VTDTAYDILFDSIGAITAVMVLSWNWSEAGTVDPTDPMRPRANWPARATSICSFPRIVLSQTTP